MGDAPNLGIYWRNLLKLRNLDKNPRYKFSSPLVLALSNKRWLWRKQILLGKKQTSLVRSHFCDFKREEGIS